MKANEFIKQEGLQEAQFLIDEWDGETTHWSIEDGFVFVGRSVDTHMLCIETLKQFVESHNLVEKCGGLASCKKKISTRNNCKPDATHFAIHPEFPHLIQMYRANEPKLEINYKFFDLENAIADVELCTPNGDKND